MPQAMRPESSRNPSLLRRALELLPDGLIQCVRSVITGTQRPFRQVLTISHSHAEHDDVPVFSPLTVL